MTSTALAGKLSMSPEVSGTHTNQNTSGSERTRNTSGISQQNMGGVIWWSFSVDDLKAQWEGTEITNEKDLPAVEFEFVGVDDIPASPPDTTEVEVLSYWSILSGENTGNRLKKALALKMGSYSNICQIIAMHIPSNLTTRCVYVASQNVYPGGPGSEVELKVERQAGSIIMKPALKAQERQGSFQKSQSL